MHENKVAIQEDLSGDSVSRRDLLLSSGVSHLFMFILFLFTVVAAISAFGTYQISIQGSKDLLETRAVDIAVNIGFSLERKGINKNLFQTVVNRDRWEDLAFLALYNSKGKTVLHSNPNLIGRIVDDHYVEQVIKNEHPSTHFEILATGERVFVLDFPLKLLLTHGGSRGVYCLRVALHAYPAQAIVRRANVQLALIGCSLLILWLISFFFIWMWRRNIKLQRRLERQGRLAALGQMSAVLAHEIRNPLSSIKGFAQYHMESQQDKALKADMEIIVHEAQRLESLTSNLLAYAKPLRFTLSSFRLDEFCETIRSLFVNQSGLPELHWHCSQDHVVMDRDILSQIILNLIQNAIDALSSSGKSNSNIWIRMWLDGASFELLVEDDGPGISEDVRDKVFDPFITTKTKGTGLGLAIVKRQVDAMGGEISIKDRKPVGTKVVISIPLDRGDEL